jgi:hypothetical protein
MTEHGLLYISMALKIRLLFWFCVRCKKLLQTIFGGFRHTGAKFPELMSNKPLIVAHFTECQPYVQQDSLALEGVLSVKNHSPNWN